MPIDADASQAPARLRLTYRGVWPSIAEATPVFEKLIADGLITPQTRVLTDIRNLQGLPGYEALRADFAAGDTLRTRPGSRAFLANRGVEFGVARMIHGMAPVTMPIEIFTDEAAALQWLASVESDLA